MGLERDFFCVNHFSLRHESPRAQFESVSDALRSVFSTLDRSTVVLSISENLLCRHIVVYVLPSTALASLARLLLRCPARIQLSLSA